MNTSAGDLERQIREMQIDGISPNPKQSSNKEDQFRSLKKYLANDKTPLDHGQDNKNKLMNDSDIAELWNNGISGKPTEMKGGAALQTG